MEFNFPSTFISGIYKLVAYLEMEMKTPLRNYLLKKIFSKNSDQQRLNHPITELINSGADLFLVACSYA